MKWKFFENSFEKPLTFAPNSGKLILSRGGETAPEEKKMTKVEIVWDIIDREARAYGFQSGDVHKRFTRMMRHHKATLVGIQADVIAETCECGDCDSCAYGAPYNEARTRY